MRLHFSPQNVRVHFGLYQANPAGIAVFIFFLVRMYEYASRSYIVDTYEYAFRVVSNGTPPIYHILEKCTATFSSYLSLKRNPVFGASAQRISRPSYTAVVALTATCDGHSEIWPEHHFSASGVSNFWQIF